MAPGDWPPGDGLPSFEEGQSDRTAAVDAAQHLVAGPSVVVPRNTLLGLIAALRTSIRVIEAVLQEGSTGTGTQPADDASAAE